MPRQVLQAPQGISPAKAAASPAPSPKPQAAPEKTVEADPYQTLRDQLTKLSLPADAVDQAVNQKRLEDERSKKPTTEKVADPIEPPKTVTAAPVSDEKFALQQTAEREEAEVPTVEASTGDEDDEHALVPAADTRLAPSNRFSQASNGAISGEFDKVTNIIPQLKVIQGNGPATANYSQGDLVYCDTVIFPGPTADKPSPAIRFIPVAVDVFWREEPPKTAPGVKRDPNLKPRNVSTAAQVHALGGTTEWTNNSNGERIKPTWALAARCILLVERPAGCDSPAFTVPVELEAGKGETLWAPAVMYVNGGAFRSLVPAIKQATNFILLEGDNIVLEKRVWQMNIVKELSGGKATEEQFTVFTPKPKILNILTPPDLRQFVLSLRARPTAEA